MLQLRAIVSCYPEIAALPAAPLRLRSIRQCLKERKQVCPVPSQNEFIGDSLEDWDLSFPS
jgi:hypothetical protein